MSFLLPQEDELPSSDSDDAEYVPSDAEGSEEEGSGVDEGESNGSDNDRPGSTKGKRKKKKSPLKTRKRKQCTNEEEEVTEKVAKVDETPTVAEKERSDSLWASFLKGVDAPPPKAKPQQVTVTKTYEFAGKKIDIQEKVPVPKSTPLFPVTKTKASSALNSSPSNSSSNNSLQSAMPVPRTSSGSSSKALLQSLLGKTPKLSTLDKSRLDWESYVDETGEKEELRIHNRGKQGFVERKAFEARTEARQFEIERDIRLKTRPK